MWRHVRPTQSGLLVLEGERIAELLSTRFWSIKAAEGLAYARHASTGAHTFVFVETIDDSGGGNFRLTLRSQFTEESHVSIQPLFVAPRASAAAGDREAAAFLNMLAAPAVTH